VDAEAGVAEFGQGPFLDESDGFAGQVDVGADFFEGSRFAAVELTAICPLSAGPN
jgi:hypothetical protein